MTLNINSSLKWKRLFFILILSFLSSCKTGNKKDLPKIDSLEKKTKLAKLLLLSPDSIIDTYDLSNDSITLFPDLSKYKIKSLNLSCNFLDTVIVGFLPQKLEKLNLSHNQIQGDLYNDLTDIRFNHGNKLSGYFI